MLRIFIFNRTPRKFLCSLANHCNRAPVNFCLFNLGDFCELINVPLYFSVFALYISNLHCVYRESRCSLTGCLFNPYEYISVILFVPFKALGGPFHLKAYVFLQHSKMFIYYCCFIIFHCFCSILWNLSWTNVGPDLQVS